LDEKDLKRRQLLIDGEVAAKRLSVMSGKVAHYSPLSAMGCSLVSVAELATLVKEHRCLVYMGAGISACRMMYNADLIAAVGREPDAQVDDQVIGVVSGDEGRNAVASAYSKGLWLPIVHETIPTAAHWALAELVRAKNWPVVTTNSDLLLDHAGASALKAGTFLAALQDAPQMLQPFSMLLCVGVGGDHRHVVKSFRERCPGRPVAAMFIGDVGNYLFPGDLVLAEDVQQSLPALARLVLDGAEVS